MTAPESNRNPVWGWSDLALFIGLALPALISGVLLVKGLSLVLPDDSLPPAAPELLGQFLGYAFLFVALAQLLKMRYSVPFWQAIGWRPDARGISWAFGIGLLLAAALILVGALVKTPKLNSPMEVIMKDPRNVPIVAIFATTLGPIAEEVIFRGFLMPLLARSLGMVAGVLLSAIPFALLHGQQYAWSWQHVLLILIAGCAFGIAKALTHSTAFAVLVHSGYNSLFLAAFFVQKWIDASPDL